MALPSQPRRFATLSLLALAGCNDLYGPEVGRTSLEPTVAESGVSVAPQRYIVRLDPGTDVQSSIAALSMPENAVMHTVWERTITGFSATLTPERAKALRSQPTVRSVRADVVMQAHAASWGLDRVGRRELPLGGGAYTPLHDGSGVDVYVVDGGIRAAHSAFGGRAVTVNGGFDALRDPTSMYYAEDCYGQADPEMDPPEAEDQWAGHGTHVAATIGGSTYGVAPGVSKLISVRVIECNNAMWLSDLISGIEWITVNADPNTRGVANLSLGGPIASDTLWEVARDAILESIEETDIVYVVSAGNDGDDACDYFPAVMSDVITVAATDSMDQRWIGAGFSSNHGTCVDIFAPGKDIVSAAAHVDEDDSCTSCSTTFSGTSMAAPHVAGIVAQVLEQHEGLSPAAVRDTVLAWATPNELSGIGSGSPNLLAFAPRILSGGITGLDTIPDTLTVQWDAEPDGGWYDYTYEWARRHYWDGVPEAWSVLGYGDSVQPWIMSGSPPFELRLKIWSGSQSHTSYKFVHVICTEPCVEFPVVKRSGSDGGLVAESRVEAEGGAMEPPPSFQPHRIDFRHVAPETAGDRGSRRAVPDDGLPTDEAGPGPMDTSQRPAPVPARVRRGFQPSKESRLIGTTPPIGRPPSNHAPIHSS